MTICMCSSCRLLERYMSTSPRSCFSRPMRLKRREGLSSLYTIVRSFVFFFFSSRRRHTRYIGDWSSDVCSSDLGRQHVPPAEHPAAAAALQHLGPPGAARERAVRPAAGGARAAARGGARPHEGRSEERRVGKECRSRRAACQRKRERSSETDTDD